MADVTLSCTCGSLTGTLKDVGPQCGTHIICHCDDCRAAHNHLGHKMPADEGIDLYQTSPDKIKIDKGGENLGVLRLSPKGLMRWYAKCCDTPMFNTLANPKMAFVGVQTAAMDETSNLPPVKGRFHRKGADGKVKQEGMMRAGGQLLSRMAKARLSGRWKDTPFFDSDNWSPVTEPTVLTLEERKAAEQPSS